MLLQATYELKEDNENATLESHDSRRSDSCGRLRRRKEKHHGLRGHGQYADTGECDRLANREWRLGGSDHRSAAVPQAVVAAKEHFEAGLAHFNLIFPRLRERIEAGSLLLADTLARCWPFGQARERWAEVEALVERAER